MNNSSFKAYPTKKRRFKLSFLLTITLLFVTFRLSAQTLEKGFINPPDSIQTSVYWYWISDNISKEGVVKDLHAMKAVGINRAFIGNIGLDDVPYGKVKMLSNEWWDILHEALKTATALNIEIGIFNSPGWSQSGGPWIKPKEAMRYLTSSFTRIKGPGYFSEKLEKPTEDFEDVKLIAYPVPKNDNVQMNSSNCSIRSVPSMSNLATLVDGNKRTGVTFPAGKSFTFQFDAKKAFTARSISISTTEKPMFAKATLQAKNAKGQYQTIRRFDINRSNAALHVGFDPYAPVVISFRAVTANSFRLIIEDTVAGNGLAEVTITSAPLVERYSEKTFAKMHPTPLPSWNDYKWPMQPELDDMSQAINPSKVIDISKFLDADGTLTWNVPAGEWMIMRTGMTTTGVMNGPASPEATGLEVDKMSRQHVEKHFDAFIGEVLNRIPEKDRTCFKVVVQDSYEMGGQNFTDDFLSEFKKRYGYDAVPYLPVYQGKVVKNQLSSDRFLWDMRRLVADKVAYDYVGGLRDVSHKHGLTTWLENYGHWGFPSEFLMYGGQSDEIAGEFWSEGELGNIENRAATSSGHIYGKTKISAESNTFAGDPFSRYPASMKQRGDRFFAEGINNTLLHVYITQPYEDKNPGMNAWFGNEFNRKNTWFSQMDVYTQYLKRTNLMLQQGLNVADVAYFIGEDAPAMTGVTDPELPVGYQFDYMNAEVIEKYMTVKDGLLTLPHGTQYRIMVLPKLTTMRPAVLAKIKQLVMDGAVILGPAPERSPSLQGQPVADQQVAAMAKQIWGNVDGVKIKMRRVGKGIIMNGMEMKEALALINCVPDCNLPVDRSIHYGHRQLNGMEIYFISNQTALTKDITAQFRVKGLQPEIWEAVTGSIRDLPAYTQRESSTAVPLKLAPYESVFIVFRKAINNKSAVNTAANYPSVTTLVNLKGPWVVKFDSLQRGPTTPVVFDTLMDWTKSADDRIKYYSGTAIYNTTFNLDKLPALNNICIELGSVTAMAKVFVNGTYAGGLWTAPYKLDISKLIKEGTNEVKIEVVNNWMNRLIGDSKLPKEERPTWSPFNTYKATSTLQPSGLFGPVKIEYIKSN